MDSNQKIFVSALLPFLLISEPAYAQENLGPKYDKFRDETLIAQKKDGERLVGAGGPLQRASGGLSASAFQFSSEQGESEATLSLAFNLDTNDPKESDQNSGFFNVSSLTATLQATAPLGQSDGVSKLFDGDSLVNGSKIKFAIHRTATSLGSGRGHKEFARIAYKSCVAKAVGVWIRDQHEDANSYNVANAYGNQFNQNLKETPDDSGQLTLRRLDDGNSEVAAFAVKQCQPGRNNADGVKDLTDLVGKYTGNLVEFERSFFDRKPVSFMGIDASLGRDSYTILDRTAFTTSKSSKNSWEVGAYYGLIAHDISWSARARVVYGKSFKSPDEVQICRTITGSTDQECLSGPDGPPTSEKTALASFELRHLVKLNSNQKVGFAPQITYDFDDKDFGIEVPVYLAPDKDGKLSGGLKFAYSSKDDDFGIGLFVGVPFSIFFE